MNDRRKTRLIQIAQNLSDLRTGKHLHFSFILNKNQLLITATNSYLKDHPKHIFGEYVPYRNANAKNYRPVLHSEIAAIRQFINKFGHSNFSGLTLFNVGFSKTGIITCSSPCMNCNRVLESFNFKEILST